MKKKGSLIFWEISDLSTTKDKLVELGLDEFTPRNDHKTALIKALRVVTKGNDKLYRRFNDGAKQVSFGIFREIVTSGDLNINKEMVFTLDKEDGSLTPSDAADRSTQLFIDISREFKDSRDTINAEQLRAMVRRIVKDDCFGIAMRQRGGIYFIDQKFDPKKERLHRLFDAFKGSAILHTVPIYDDSGTLDAIEHAASEDVFGDIDELVSDIEKKFKEGSITKRILETRKEEADAILGKIKVHELNLRSKAASVTDRLKKVQDALTKVTGRVEAGIVEPFDFLAALKAL